MCMPCRGSTCQEEYRQKQNLKALNKSGVYSPEQIDDVLNESICKIYLDEETRLFKNDEVIKGAEIIEEIVNKCVTELGKMGNKLKFNKELYD